jgi:hypothetical protein
VGARPRDRQVHQLERFRTAGRADDDGSHRYSHFRSNQPPLHAQYGLSTIRARSADIKSRKGHIGRERCRDASSARPLPRLSC